jgi:hypothetical protein
MAWLISDRLMNSLCLQAQGGGSLEENFLDGTQSAPLSGCHTQQAYCAPDKMTAFSRLSRFGMTFKPLTENHGEELLMLYLAGFHAKTSVLPEKAQESTEHEAGCGNKWHASFTKFDPASSSWKTHQCSLQGDLEPFLETWPQWGLMRDGECWEQQTLEQTIKGTEFGLLEHWPTPRSCSAMAATITPESAWNANRNPNLETIVGRRLWPTPTAHNAKETNAPSESRRNTPSLAAQAGGQLNPTWVEWLMGWPLGWTDLKPLETDKFHQWQQQHGKS